MYKAKTTENDSSVTAFINSATEKQRLTDSLELVRIFEEASGYKAKMWGPAIIGFGSYHYVYASGHEGDAPLAGFSPRKNNLTLYIISDYDKKDPLLDKLGKHKMSKACVYINKLEDISIPVLKKLISNCVKASERKYKVNK